MNDLHGKDLQCEVCKCKTGTFKIEGDELILHYTCGHQSAGLVMNLSYIGDEIEGPLN